MRFRGESEQKKDPFDSQNYLVVLGVALALHVLHLVLRHLHRLSQLVIAKQGGREGGGSERASEQWRLTWDKQVPIMVVHVPSLLVPDVANLALDEILNRFTHPEAGQEILTFGGAKSERTEAALRTHNVHQAYPVGLGIGVVLVKLGKIDKQRSYS